MKILLLLLTFLFSTSCFATAQDKLQRINIRISELQATIKAENESREKFQTQLETIETKAADISKSLNQTETDLKTQRTVLQKLNNTIQQNKIKLDSQKNQLATLLRQAYQMGNEPLLKILLNQTNLEKSERMLVYYRYLSEAQVKLLTDLQNTLASLQQTEASQQIQMTKLTALEKVLRAQQSSVIQTKHQREQLVAKIDHQLSSRKQKLANLLSDRDLLQNTLRHLNAPTLSSGNFNDLKGQLAWPARGHLLDYFNKPIEHSELKWDGIIIQAPEDTPVRAVANGQVVFAKWMPGYGLLLIINHGGGYMTLYGRNHYLYKKVGDTVRTGDLIAMVGKSGGYQKSALYFAIRHDAKPLDPVKWCQ